MKVAVRCALVAGLLMGAVWTMASRGPQVRAGANEASTYNPTQVALQQIAKMNGGDHDWPQWGGWTGRNNTPDAKNIPIEWNVEDGTNIKWKAALGSQTYGNAVVANGKVFVGTNNGAGYIKRYPRNVDLGCLLCFDEKTGK